MSKQLYESQFSEAPTDIEIHRTRFSRPFNVTTSLNAGLAVPFYVDEVLPGDTFEVKTSIVARMSTLLRPVMDNAFIDYYYFFCPTRLVWEHWKEFQGENTSTFWTQPTEYTIPQLIANGANLADPENAHLPQCGSVWDYFGLPASSTADMADHSGVMRNVSVNALPFRCYAEIWNNWFRDQNVMTPIHINKGDSNDFLPLLSSKDYVTDSSIGGVCAPVARYHDYFSSSLPSPQKGDSVLLPLGDYAPVFTQSTLIPLGKYRSNLLFSRSDGSPMSGFRNIGIENASSTGVAQTLVADDSTSVAPANPLGLVPRNLFADLSQATASTISDLRNAFAVQRQLERDSRSGSRLREVILANFGVRVPDSTIQVPEYLGGRRILVNVQSVTQTSETTTDSPQGNLTGMSVTVDSNNDFIKSFTEHGYVIGIMCVRTSQTYQQGINRMFSRKRRFDFYMPTFAHLSEQSVLNKEVYIDTSDDSFSDPEGVFGYQERWAEYRYKPNTVTGMMRSGKSFDGSNLGLDSWHFANWFENLPQLNSSFIKETTANIDRTLAVPSNLAHQFICDISVDNISTRPMPLYSVPGLIDHN